MKNNNKIKKISKNELIHNIAHLSNVTIQDTKLVMDVLEDTIKNELKEVNSDKDVSIKIFDGLCINGIYIPETTKKNNLTGEVINVGNKIKIKPKVSRVYIDKINH